MYIELYFDDLTADKQAELLEAMGIDDPKEMNWDIFPITEIYLDNKGDE